MPKANRSKSGRAAGEKTSQTTGGAGTVLKWIGGGTAVLSLVFGLRQLTVLISDARDRQRQVTELIATGKLQQAARDYRAAWISLGKAAELRANDLRVRTAREDLAMAWLDDVRGSSGQTPFSALVDTLVPVLSRGAVAVEGERKADLLAHLGWADFLRWRDGQRNLEPAERYRQALAVDSQDVYAHAMLAHWMLWNGGSLEDANPHFVSALRSGRQHPYVRHLELAALTNMGDAGELEMLRVANEMRKGDEPMDADGRDRIWDAYYSRIVSSPAEDSIDQLFATVPPAEHVATYRWVFEGTGYVESKGVFYDYLLARLQDAAGEREPALATYRSVRSRLPAGRIRARVESDILRLTKH